MPVPGRSRVAVVLCRSGCRSPAGRASRDLPPFVRGRSSGPGGRDRIVEVNEITMLGERFELYYDLPAQ